MGMGMGTDTIHTGGAPPAANADVEKAQPTTITVRHDAGEVFPGPKKVAIIMVSLYLAMFLVALDRTILGTAIPKITDDFHSITDVGWYASAYMLTSCAFQLIYGRIYTFYNTKYILLCCILLFEIGSALCGAAPTSKAFILGRALAGLGSAGIFSGCINTMVITIPLHKRPIYQGIFGAVFGVASVAGPLIGGVFTTKVSWRWCFYINLPIGAVVVVILTFLLEARPSKNTDSFKQQIIKLDPLGTLFFLPGIICLLLALQWGGTTYAWKSGTIIALFVVAAVLISIFIVIQFKSGDNATIPIRIIRNRSVAAGTYFSVMGAGTMMIALYYLPIYFQAIKGASAIRSGINTIPLVLALVTAAISAGQMTARTGYYVPQLIVCSVIMSIGAGLFTTFKVNSSTAYWAGTEFLYGFGLGLGMQQSGMAAQTCLKRQDVMTGVALMFFFQSLGGAIFISIAQVVFSNSLVKDLTHLNDPAFTISPKQIINTGATQLRDIVPPQFLGLVLPAYNSAVMGVFKVGVACAAASIIAGCTMEWKSVKGLKQGGEPVTPPVAPEGMDGGEGAVTDSRSQSEVNGNGNEKGEVRTTAPASVMSEKTGAGTGTDHAGIAKAGKGNDIRGEWGDGWLN